MKTLVSIAAVAACAGGAFGLGETLERPSEWRTYDASEVTMISRPLDARTPLGNAPTSVYGWDDNDPTIVGAALGRNVQANGTDGPPSQSDALVFEDYGSTLDTSGAPNGDPAPSPAGDYFGLTRFEVAVDLPTTGSLAFAWYDNAGTFIDGFFLNGFTAGVSVWFIEIDGLTPFTTIPGEGIFSVQGTLGIANSTPIQFTWLQSAYSANPTNGRQDQFIPNALADTDGDLVGDTEVARMFALGVPTPGTVSLLGVAGILGLRRRR